MAKRSTSMSSNQKFDFYQIKLRKCVLAHFHVILTGKSFHGIMCVIQGDLQGKKGNFKVKFQKIILFPTNIIVVA